MHKIHEDEAQIRTKFTVVGLKAEMLSVVLGKEPGRATLAVRGCELSLSEVQALAATAWLTAEH